MIKIFSKESTDFNNNGLGILRDSISCIAREELNGLFDLSMEYPLFGVNSEHLIEDNIIMAPTPRGEQPFRIYSTETNLNTIYINARHIFYDLQNNFLEDVRPTSQNGAGALNWILSNTQFTHSFTSSSDITKSSSASYVRKNVVEALLSDDENSFVNRWGGELIRDKWNITINQEAGADRGVKILYGKNLLGLNASVDISNVITRIMPTGLNEDDTVLSLPEKYIDSPYINSYSSPRIAHYHYSDIKIGEELTEAEALDLLREQASVLFSQQKIDEPVLNISVDFLELSKTEEYKNYSILETIYPFDVVTVEYFEIGFSQKAKMISYEYDCLLEKYNNIELGQFLGNYAHSQAKTGQLLERVSKEIEDTKTNYQKAIDNATDLITGWAGGYLILRPKDHPSELLIMDTPDVNTAQDVLRINGNGIGFSSTGINGPFSSAWTLDGTLNMAEINVINLAAELIKTGVLQDKLGKNYLDMDNGTFSLGGGKIFYDGNKLDINAEAVKLAMGEIGSVQLIKNSSFRNNRLWWVNSGPGTIAYLKSMSVTDGIGVSITNTALNQDTRFRQTIAEGIDRNASRLVISGWLLATGTLGTTNPYVGLQVGVTYTDGTTSYFNLRSDNDQLTGGWKYYSRSFSVTKQISSILIQLVNRDLNGILYASQLKLEQGENPTAWSLHPSELQGNDYNFTGSSFIIGNRATGSVAEHTAEYSRWTHSDGSYTQAGIDGFERWISATGNKYRSLVYIDDGYLDIAASSSTDEQLNIQLPAEFKGKNFDVMLAVSNIITAGDVWRFRASLVNDSNQVDRANAIIKPYVGLHARDSSGNRISGTIVFSYIVVA